MNGDVVYQCGECGWSGNESELEYDLTETCFGDDRIEICPECGSMLVFIRS